MLVQSGKCKVPEQRACFEHMNKLLAAEEKVSMQNKLESTAVAATSTSAEGTWGAEVLEVNLPGKPTAIVTPSGETGLAPKRAMPQSGQPLSKLIELVGKRGD